MSMEYPSVTRGHLNLSNCESVCLFRDSHHSRELLDQGVVVCFTHSVYYLLYLSPYETEIFRLRFDVVRENM